MNDSYLPLFAMAEREGERQPDGYVDPNIPNPNGDGDAPVIIYGYGLFSPLSISRSPVFFPADGIESRYTPHLSLSALALALYSLLLILYIFHLLPLQRQPHKASIPPLTTDDVELNGTAITTDPTTTTIDAPTPSKLARIEKKAAKKQKKQQKLAAKTRHRTPCTPFTILLTIATLFEIVGYAFRLRSSPPPTGNPYAVINFVIQYFFIVVAPVFISAAIYTTLTYLIRLVGDEFSPLKRVKRKSIVTVFVVCDVVATCVQVAGAALIGSAESNGEDPTTPNHILLAGLAFQVASFLGFLVLLGRFLGGAWGVLVARKGNGEGEQGMGRGTGTGMLGKAERSLGGMKGFVIALVVVSLLIYLRTIFRLAETCQGVGGYASSQEALFGALEFAPVVLAVAGLGVWHPGVFVGRQ